MPLYSRLLAVVAFVMLPSFASSADPLHTRIDKHIARGFGDNAKHAAPRASDEEFFRRVYLDLVGTIPTVSELNDFLADSAKDKREKLIDKLLASPGYARRMAWFFDVTLMERGKDVQVPRAAWEAHPFPRSGRAAPPTSSQRQPVAADPWPRRQARHALPCGR